jgi:small subunit ribosomal protein S20
LANIKSQKKRIITNEVARLRNKDIRSSVKTAAKKVDTTVEAGDKDAATAAMLAANRQFDIAVSKGVYTQNHAANQKSKMARMVNRMGA